MLTSMDDRTVSEMKRDILVAFYLKNIVPNSNTLSERHLETVDDLYKYLLIDPEISAHIMTTPVASAIASLQTFITDVSLNREPDIFLSEEQLDAWKTDYHRYSLWSANQLLSAYPENYIDPSLRYSKTGLFESLETALNQNQLTEDIVQDAVFNYLNEFEITSNLQVISGYQDKDDIDHSTMYFIGRTRLQPYEYYWRKLDMRKRDPANPKIIYPDAWSAWKKIQLPIVDAVNTMVRPVVFKGRLFIVWLELRDQRESKQPIAKDGQAGTGAQTKLHLKLGFKRFDDSWSPNQDYTLLENEKTLFTEDKIKSLLVTVTQFGHFSLLCAAIYISQKKEKEREEKVSPVFFSIDELLTLNERRMDIFDEYPFKDNVISIAKPVNHMNVSYLIKNPEQTISMKRGGFGGMQVNVIAHLGKSSNGNVRLEVEVKAGISRVQFPHTKITLETEPKMSSESRHDLVDKVYLYYDLEADGETIIKQGLKIEGTYDVGMQGFSTGYFSVTINLAKQGGNFEDSTAYVSEEDEIQLLNFAKEQGLPPIRLNTLFAKELIRLANVGLDDLLHLYNQYDNDAISPNQDTTIDIQHADLDFYGANGLYFWELFFYMPFLVAYNLNLQQRFEQATHWFQYIFDPLKGMAFCWNVKVLLHDLGHPELLGAPLGEPIDPDDIALARPIHYRKTIFRHYVSNLIDQGDALYRELTPDSLVEAKSYYIMARDLLGPRPDNSISDAWQPITLHETVQQKNLRLLAFAKQFTEKMEHESVHFSTGYVKDLAHDPTVDVLNNGLFYQPINEKLLMCWDTLDSRLYNLRHNLSIDGKPLHLPLFSPPLDPGQLLAQRNQSQGLDASFSYSNTQSPYYRFSLLINKAHYAVDTLIQFGNTLMSVFERRDNRLWETLQSEQQKALLDFTLMMQNDAIDLMKANNESLNISKQAVIKRRDYYKKLADDGLLLNERLALGMLEGSAAALYASIPSLMIAGGLNEAPNIFGLADGGSEWGAFTSALAGGAMNTGFALSTTASALQVKSEYNRRSEEWAFQKELAESDNDLIEQQIKIGEKQLNTSQLQLNQIKKQQAQIQESLNFFSTRFSNQALYQWMLGQLSALYRQAYDGVIALCLAAQAAWQYEIGDFKTRFILPGAWNDRYHGLLVGETLKLYLQRMEQQYLQRHERKLEITKTVSLKCLLGEEKLRQLKTQGKVDFDLTEKEYSLNYPGHYLRQITAVSISLPTVLGPYQDVKAILTQVSNHLLMLPDKSGFESLWARKPTGVAVQSDLRARQQIALSTGLEESGLFVLNFGDDRYLPFEGTGAVSSWELEFPNAESYEQQTILRNLTDVIIRIRYTAKDGGGHTEFKAAVDAAVKVETEKRNKQIHLLKQQKIQEITTETSEEKIRF